MNNYVRQNVMIDDVLDKENIALHFFVKNHIFMLKIGKVIMFS